MQISLVRLHSEKIKPPRALWVPFELGRPLGVPNDPKFQHRVIAAVLGLLKYDKGPVLEDYLEEAPDGEANEEQIAMDGQFCPINLISSASKDSDLMQALEAEINHLAPWYEMAVNQRRRTTVGVSGLDILESARLLAAMAESGDLVVPRNDLEPGPMLKLCCEDLSSFYGEAISVQPGMNTSMAVESWIWGHTVLGETMWKIREVNLDSKDDFMRYHAQRSLVPDRQIQLREENPRVFRSWSLDEK